MSDRTRAPDRPTRPETPAPKGNWLGLLLAAGAAMLIFLGLLFLTGGFLGLVLIVAGGVFALAGFHYLVWGWWLSTALHAEEEAAQSERREQTDRNDDARSDRS